MAGDGLDDELLALAGGSDDERPRKSSNTNANSSSDEDQQDDGARADRKRPSTKGSSIAKRRRLDLLNQSDSSDQDAPGSSEEEQDDEASESADPYPLYGIYKNHKDMDALQQMNEVERETILEERRRQIEKRQQRIDLANLVRSQKAAAGATRRKGARQQDSDASEEDDDDEFTATVSSAAKARKKKAVGATDTKTAKLSELRKRRKEKASGLKRHDSDDDVSPKKRGGRGYASSDDDESSSGDENASDEGYGKSKAAASRKSKVGRERDREDNEAAKKEPPSLSDLNNVRISRDLIEQKLYAPKWKEALIGSFIRFSWGQRDREDGQGKETYYRIHQVQDVTEKPNKFYDLSSDGSGKWTNVYLSFEHLGKDYEASLNMLSRSDFIESERDRWLRTIMATGQRMPRKRELEEKAEQLESFFAAALTENDIVRMLGIKKKLRQEAASRHAITAAAKKDTPAGKYDQHVLGQMNDRNRKQDRERIVEAEKRAAQAKKAARIAADTPNGSGANTPLRATQQQGQDGSLLQNAVKSAASKIEIDLGDF